MSLGIGTLYSQKPQYLRSSSSGADSRRGQVKVVKSKYRVLEVLSTVHVQRKLGTDLKFECLWPH